MTILNTSTASNVENVWWVTFLMATAGIDSVKFIQHKFLKNALLLAYYLFQEPKYTGKYKCILKKKVEQKFRIFIKCN